MEKARECINKGIGIAEKANYKLGLAGCYYNSGLCYESMGKYDSALTAYQNALTNWQTLATSSDSLLRRKGKRGMATTLNGIGNTYRYLSEYPKSLDYYLKALVSAESVGDKRVIASCLGNIGLIYRKMSELDKALEYQHKCLNIAKEIGDKRLIANTLGNIGNVYGMKGDVANAISYQEQCLKIAQETGNKQLIANTLGNIGSIYSEASDSVCARLHISPAEKEAKAIKYLLDCQEIFNQIGDKQGVAVVLGSIGTIYQKSKKFNEAIRYTEEAVKLATEVGDLDSRQEYERVLYEIYKTMGNKAKALDHYEVFISLKDSIFKVENQKEIVRKEMKYEFGKKEALTNAEHEKELAIADAEQRKQKVITWSVLIGLLFVIGFAGFIFRSLRITRKQKHIIELQKGEVVRQKELVEVHQKEIIDSITYAKRLQEAILPPLDFVKKNLPDSFVLYKPKDIVAGDFYWMEVFGDTVFIAAADSTGHGVPGAMVSVVCSNALNRTVKEFGLRETGKILDKVTELVLETFEKSDKDVKDGMDISLLAINKATRQIQWSGANNPLWYIQNGELLDITADKQPIGKHDNRKPFSTHSIACPSATTFYLFTDGYADQFGGAKGKKFKYKQLEEKLLEASKLPLTDQGQMLAQIFDSWKGEYEQVDDVCIIGISLSPI